MSDIEDHGAHPSHCCAQHGCKYGDDDCPVVAGKVAQKYPCEDDEHERCFPLLAGTPGNYYAAREGTVTVRLDDGTTFDVAAKSGDVLWAIALALAEQMRAQVPRTVRK